MLDRFDALVDQVFQESKFLPPSHLDLIKARIDQKRTSHLVRLEQNTLISNNLPQLSPVFSPVAPHGKVKAEVLGSQNSNDFSAAHEPSESSNLKMVHHLN